MGAIMRARPDTGGKKTAVVKIGTGLAGGILQGSADEMALATGLYEWGKLILDVGAPRREDFPFPQGVAAEYLSNRCLPRLAQRKGSPRAPGDPGYFQRDNPDSAEIGLILDMAQSPSVGAFKCLMNECGVIQAERHPLRGIPVPAEVLRLLLDPKKFRPLDDDLLHRVRLALVRYGDIEEQLKKDLKAYGLLRLGRLIGYTPKKMLPVRQKSEWRDAVHARFTAAGEIAKECADLLGSYLGDFCVLLFDELGVDRLILAGGVLSGKTGERAREAARKRVEMYGLKLKPDGSPQTYSISELQDTKGNGEETAAEKEKEDRGTLGAACFSAASFIQSKKHEGLKQLRACLLPLPTGSPLRVSGSNVSVSGVPLQESDGSGQRPIDFREYALTEKDLVDFLTTHGPEWGYYQAENNYSFVRWLVRN